MKRLYVLVAAAMCAALPVFVSCRTLLINAVSTSLSGANKKGIPSKQKKSNADPMLAITGETDVTLVGDFFPTILKVYEILQQANPNHLGLMTMTGSLNIMYANAFVAAPAESLPNEAYDKQYEEFLRAKLHYIRGRDLCLNALDSRHKGFKDNVMSGDEDKLAAACALLDKHDVEAAYWACAGWLGAFSLDPLNPDMLGNLRSPASILEKVAALDPDYSNGAIWDVLTNFYVSAPADFGGDYERGLYCHEQAVRASGGQSPGPYVTYAESVCIPAGDEAGFDEALAKALAINPDDNPSSRLMATISQRRAKMLLEHKSDYFLEW